MYIYIYVYIYIYICIYIYIYICLYDDMLISVWWITFSSTSFRRFAIWLINLPNDYRLNGEAPI